MTSPEVGEWERDYAEKALHGGWDARLGPEVGAFEDQVAARTGRAYAVALSSGTAALHLGLLAMGVGPGDTVVTSPSQRQPTPSPTRVRSHTSWTVTRPET